MLSLVLLGALAAASPAFSGSVEDATVELLGSREPEVDTDGDGKTDVTRKFDPKGKLLQVNYDLNADGKHDEEVRFEPTGSVRLRDTDLDGEFDERVTETYSGRSLLKQTTESKAGADWRIRSERRYLPERRSFQVIDYETDGRKKGERVEPADLR